MFDSSKQQPDPHSNIDFLHNGASDARGSVTKQVTEVELIHNEQTVKKAGQPVEGIEGIVGRLLKRMKGMVLKRRSEDHLNTQSSGLLSRSTAVEKHETIHEIPEHGNAIGAVSVNDVAPQESPRGNGVSQHEVKGKPIEKIPLDKFHDPSIAKHHTTPSSIQGQRVGASLLFHSDTMLGDDELDINLLPVQRRKISSRTKRALSVGCLSLEFVCLIVGFLAIQAKADGRLLGLRELESQQTLLDIQVKRYREVVKEATALQQQASLLKQVLEKRVPYLEIFSWFEAHTVDSVYYTTFSVTGSGDVSIHVVAPSPEDALHQMNIFTSTKAWDEVETSSVSLKQEHETFPVEFDAQFKGFVAESEDS